jgi:hypothetical protein
MATAISPDPPPSTHRHPVRLVIVDDGRRRRWAVAFRLLLVIPHYIALAVWSVGAFVVALANWLITLVSGKPPAGLHRFLSLYVRYATQVYAYLLLAADPYPPFDPRRGYPVDVEIDPPARQSRVAVAFRLVLALPALLIAGALFGLPSTGRSSAGIYEYTSGITHVAAILGWFACVAVKRMPRGLRDSTAWGVGFGAQLWAYLLVLTSAYPNSDPGRVLGALPARSDAVALTVREDLRRSRLTVFFRLPLTFPHLVWLALWSLAAFFAALANWLVTLVRGRPPRALHAFLSAYLRYQTHVYAFLTLAANPFPGFVGAAGSYPVEVAIAPPQRQNRWSTGFRLLLALPMLLLAGAYGTLLWTAAILGWFAALVTAAMPLQLRNAAAQALRCIAQVNGYVLVLSDAYPYGGPSELADEAASPPANVGPRAGAEPAFG